MTEPTSRICTFRVNGLLLGLKVSDVQEVVKSQHITPVPLAPPLVLGLVNLRGLVLPAVNLKWRIGLKSMEGDCGIHVVLRHGTELISLPVDSIEDVVTLDNHRRSNPPENLPLSLRDACAAAWDLGNQLLLELDPERLIRPRESENT